MVQIPREVAFFVIEFIKTMVGECRTPSQVKKFCLKDFLKKEKIYEMGPLLPIQVIISFCLCFGGGALWDSSSFFPLLCLLQCVF